MFYRQECIFLARHDGACLLHDTVEAEAGGSHIWGWLRLHCETVGGGGWGWVELQNPQDLTHRHMWTEINQSYLKSLVLLNLFGIVFMSVCLRRVHSRYTLSSDGGLAGSHLKLFTQIHFIGSFRQRSRKLPKNCDRRGPQSHYFHWCFLAVLEGTVKKKYSEYLIFPK